MQLFYNALLSLTLLVCSTISVLAQRHPHHPPKPPKPHHPHHPHHPPHQPSATYAVFLTNPVDGQEAGADAGFTIASYSATGTATLTAYYTVSGNASAGADYEPFTGTASLHGSDSSFVPIHILDDYDIEGTEYIIIRLDSVVASSPGSRINIEVDTLTLAITDNDWNPADYKVVVTDRSSGAEGGPDGSITVALEGNKAAPENIAVIFEYDQYHDDAIPGADYNFQMSVIIPAGQYSATGIVSIVDDNTPEPGESANFSIIQAYGLDTYSPYAFEGGATVGIRDNDGGVSVTTSNGAEGGANGAFIFSLPPGTTYHEDINIYFILSGTAIWGEDFYTNTYDVTIPAGQNQATVPVEVIDDANVETPETVRLDIWSVSTYPTYSDYPVQVINNVVTIYDNDSLQLSRLATTNISTRPPVVGIYPNPVMTDLYVNIDKPVPGARLLINTADGKVLIRKNIISSRESISLAALPAGIYFVTINNGGKITTHKIIKQ